MVRHHRDPEPVPAGIDYGFDSEYVALLYEATSGLAAAGAGAWLSSVAARAKVLMRAVSRRPRLTVTRT